MDCRPARVRGNIRHPVRRRRLPAPPDGGRAPLLVGGHALAALKRALEYGSGWIGFNLDPTRVGEIIKTIRALAADEGRDLEAFEVTAATDLQLDPAIVDEFEAAGVDRLIVMAEADSLEDVEVIVRDNAPSALRG